MVAGVISGSEKLEKEMNRRCSHCGHNGHNSRTCPERGIRLFGVRLTEGMMRKSVSMGNLSHYLGSSNQPNTPEHSESAAAAEGYLSDGLVQISSNSRERKKGLPWTEEEHRLFLIGLQKLGKGDWRGISRNYVTTRTPTQVASHAQKYFIRQSNLTRRKRRSSLFDLPPEPDANLNGQMIGKITEKSVPVHQLNLGQGAMISADQFVETNDFQVVPMPLGSFSLPAISSSIPISELTLGSMPTVEEEVLKANYVVDHNSKESEDSSIKCGVQESLFNPSLNTPIPTFAPTQVHYPLPIWVGLGHPTFTPPPNSNIVKPTPTVSAAPLWMDEDPQVPQLRLGISVPESEPSPLSLNLDQPSRQSAFHSKVTLTSSNSQCHEGVNAPIISVL